MAEQTFTVTGMICDHCVHAVTAELSRLPGVSAVHVDLATGAVTVTSEGPQPIDADAVRSAIDEAGYTVGG